MYPEDQNARATYTAAAASFRIPYWDWTVASNDGSVLPSSTTIPYIDVDGPYGMQTIWNPLSSYPFQLPLNITDLPDFPVSILSFWSRLNIPRYLGHGSLVSRERSQAAPDHSIP
jgi:tyrosinase